MTQPCHVSHIGRGNALLPERNDSVGVNHSDTRSNRLRNALRIGLLTLVGAGLAGCGTSPSFLVPNSSIATHQADLFKVLLYLSAGVFIIVEGALLFSIVRFRRRKGDDAPAVQVHGNPTLEITWTVLPILLVAVLFILTVRTVSAIAAPLAGPEDVVIRVIGHRWWWEFQYPDLGFVTANEMHVPVGATVQLDVESVDVIHSFWVPQLSGKADAVPGQVNHLWFEAMQTGNYHGQCSEYCGLNHANMRLLLVVDSPSEFDAWVENQQAPPPMPQGSAEQDAFDLITKGICTSCHALGQPPGPSGADESEHEKVLAGPNLNHLFSRSVFAGATFEVNPDNIRRWLVDNEHMKPGNDMTVRITPEQVDFLMAYLTRLH